MDNQTARYLKMTTLDEFIRGFYATLQKNHTDFTKALPQVLKALSHVDYIAKSHIYAAFKRLSDDLRNDPDSLCLILSTDCETIKDAIGVNLREPVMENVFTRFVDALHRRAMGAEVDLVPYVKKADRYLAIMSKQIN